MNRNIYKKRIEQYYLKKYQEYPALIPDAIKQQNNFYRRVK